MVRSTSDIVRSRTPQRVERDSSRSIEFVLTPQRVEKNDSNATVRLQNSTSLATPSPHPVSDYEDNDQENRASTPMYNAAGSGHSRIPRHGYGRAGRLSRQESCLKSSYVPFHERNEFREIIRELLKLETTARESLQNCVNCHWSDNQRRLLELYLRRLQRLLESAKQKVQTDQDTRRAINKLINNSDFLKMGVVYEMALKQVKKDPGWHRFYAETCGLEARYNREIPHQTMDLLQDLFCHAQGCQKRLESVLMPIAKHTNGALHAKGTKHIYRAFEKTAMRRDPEQLYKSDIVLDMTRAILEYKTISGVLEGWNVLERQTGISIKRVKNRFLKPNGSGWADMVVSITFNDDPHAHVMEVQLCHMKLILCRKQLGGHKEYAKYRNCLELKELYSEKWRDDIPLGRLIRTDSYTLS